MVKYTDPVSSNLEAQARQQAGWGIVIGIIMVVLGLVAIARPFYATIASTLVFGWLFISAGVLQLLYAMRSPNIRGFAWKMLLSVLFLGTGLYTINNPTLSAQALTLVLGITIFAQGAIEVVLAFMIRPAMRWVGLLIAGIAGIILGIFIWSRFPSNADWVIGLLVGLHFLFTGTWILFFSSLTRSALR
ncbi:MAG: DUF308 domain-containing protein [Leptolyngbyaceae cyanobacterium bins.349]|nr:DUF308 domain-containing protein [Leptolyngbyaceae cyanobacterium bins.349]